MSVENTQNSRPLSFTERVFDRKNLVAGAVGTATAAAVIASAMAIKSYVGAEPSIFKIPTSFSDVKSSITGFPSWAYANQDSFSGAIIGNALGRILVDHAGLKSSKYTEKKPTLLEKLSVASVMITSIVSGSTIGAALLKTARNIL